MAQLTDGSSLVPYLSGFTINKKWGSGFQLDTQFVLPVLPREVAAWLLIT